MKTDTIGWVVVNWRQSLKQQYQLISLKGRLHQLCPARLCNHHSTTAILTMWLLARWLSVLRKHAGRGRDLN